MSSKQGYPGLVMVMVLKKRGPDLIKTKEPVLRPPVLVEI
jgi:hypothetical protein